MTAEKPRIRDDLAFVEIDGEVVIYDETTEDLHHLNPTASIVFVMCDGSASIEDLAEDISQTYEVSTQEVEPQIRDLVEQFGSVGLLAQATAAG